MLLEAATPSSWWVPIEWRYVRYYIAHILQTHFTFCPLHILQSVHPGYLTRIYYTYLIFVIFLHRQNFWRIKFTPKKRVNYDKIHSKLPIFCVESVKIYTGQKQFTQACSWRSWPISGMRPSLVLTPKFNLLPQLITNRKTPFPKSLWEHAWINPIRIVVHNSRTVAFLLVVQGSNMIIFFLFYFFEASFLLCRSYVQMLTIAVYRMHEMLTCICYSAFMPHNVARINCPSKCDRISAQG